MSSESGEGWLSNGATPIFIASGLWKIDNNRDVAEKRNFQQKNGATGFRRFLKRAKTTKPKLRLKMWDCAEIAKTLDFSAAEEPQAAPNRLRPEESNR